MQVEPNPCGITSKLESTQLNFLSSNKELTTEKTVSDTCHVFQHACRARSESEPESVVSEAAFCV